MVGARLLIVDDDAEVRYFLREALRRDGFAVDEAESTSEAIRKAGQGGYDLVLLDHRLPDAEGITIVGELRRLQPDALVLMMTAYGTRGTALEAIRRGAYDFLTKPVKLDDLRVVLARALERRNLTMEVRSLRGRLPGRSPFDKLLGDSPAMREVFQMLEKVLDSDTTVLVLGESGTGKELVAEAIHEHGARSKGPFVKLNCVAIPDTLLESELFGHEKGAFTGAHQRKVGKFELADGGTILLDEIGDMGLDTQAKILRVLQEREFERVGGVETVRVDVRVVAATNRDLPHEVEQRMFRQDLYFRLNVVTVPLPPLRRRREDIGLLAEHFLRVAAQRQNKPLRSITPAAIDALQAYDWPGNVRQLQHAIERAVIWADGEELARADLPAEVVSGALMPRSGDSATPDSLPATLHRIEQQLLVDALREAAGIQATAARRLGITERSMWHKVKKYGIDVDRYKIG